MLRTKVIGNQIQRENVIDGGGKRYLIFFNGIKNFFIKR